MSTYSTKPLQLRARRHIHNCTTITTTIISLMMALIVMATPTCAQVMELDVQVYESSFYQELAARGEIHIDRREPPPRRNVYLERRQAGDSVVPTTVTEPTSTSTSSTSSSEVTITSSADPTSAISTETKTPLSTPGVSTLTAPSVTVVTTPLPTPFDTSLGSNFTSSSCPEFFSNFLNNSTFQSCVPVSLLLQNSNSFFRAQRSFTLLTQTLDAACNAPLAICSPLLSSLASQLIDNANCGEDYKQQNPLVSQAYAGFLAYEPIYRATCLKDQSTGNYCFSEAITNSSNAADFYPYYTAVGLSMPETARPTCSQCLQETMQIFAGYAENAAQPLAKTYLPCATQVDQSCGSGFVNTQIKAGSVASSNAAIGGKKLVLSSPLLVIATLAMALLGVVY
ncbi:uncharacterized protein PV07_11013 [Cladophialophora immunda]|uniref:DUF7729 domain-containing protein n=1 Tax=Cladophialophora immunda TaxID=569365 RepID=A0A0D2AD07_9EURO|nr:uncharacterized protein PV07_11013 [Cladophialophora immunda]KIW22747.1 hypothetical protein PV07_11013 [Cladophialophora immunda]OQU94035.1 hypothetical protein CLAIMM_00456 [Cladophialophora immunda]